MKHTGTVLSFISAVLIAGCQRREPQPAFVESTDNSLDDIEQAHDRSSENGLVGESDPSAAAREQSQRHLRRIANAMWSFWEEHRHFPPAVGVGPDGKTQHSWRVALLPYLDEKDLHEQYKYSEPWDGPNNSKLLNKMPTVYRDPGLTGGSDHTSYFVPMGEETIFDASKGTTVSEITDGTTRTILVIETKRPIPWTKPEDVPYDSRQPLPDLGGLYAGGFNAVMADGTPRFIEYPALDELEFRDLFTKDQTQRAINGAMAEMRGTRAPDFILRDLHDQPINLVESIRDKVALITFFGCG